MGESDVHFLDFDENIDQYNGKVKVKWGHTL